VEHPHICPSAEDYSICPADAAYVAEGTAIFGHHDPCTTVDHPSLRDKRLVVFPSLFPASIPSVVPILPIVIVPVTPTVIALHDASYVHGDLRGPNTLLTADGLKPIGFDWCGKEGKARYPVDILIIPQLEWHSDVCRGV
jgi:hypothetical protein